MHCNNTGPVNSGNDHQRRIVPMIQYKIFRLVVEEIMEDSKENLYNDAWA